MDHLEVEGFGKWPSVVCANGKNVGVDSDHGRILHQCHVVSTQSDDEQDGPDILETADPLPPLCPLASDVIQPAEERRKRADTSLIISS